MRITLLTALMMVAAMAWADEPKTPDAKAEAPAPAPAASQPAASDTATAAVAPKDEEKPFTPPPGYKPKRINGEQVWCAKLVVLGSRFPKEDCRNESDLRELALRKQEMRRDVDSSRAVCATANGACGQN